MNTKPQPNNIRIAWLVPSVKAGAYFGPIICECNRIFKETIFYTGQVWPNFSLENPGARQVQVVGNTKFMESVKVESGYSQGFIVASPVIALDLVKYRPDVIIASAFSLWTLIALLLKPLYRWKVIVVYDGFSPNTSYKATSLRSVIRSGMGKAIDAFIANNHGAENYLTQTLKLPPDKVLRYPYLTSDIESLKGKSARIESAQPLKKPIFTYVGRLIERKGVKALFAACALLEKRGFIDYSLLIIGEGDQQTELQMFAQQESLSAQIVWTGWLEYQQLGDCFQLADVFVFPTYEDVWGMVVLEAMAFGKPVLCSKWAGAMEMIDPGENGYLFDPHQPETLAKLMQHCIEHPEMTAEAGKSAEKAVSQYSPTATARTIASLATALLS
ncbi:MAG: glycosyltransferase family 4 protein [Phormidesmis sp.]